MKTGVDPWIWEMTWPYILIYDMFDYSFNRPVSSERGMFRPFTVERLEGFTAFGISVVHIFYTCRFTIFKIVFGKV